MPGCFSDNFPLAPEGFDDFDPSRPAAAVLQRQFLGGVDVRIPGAGAVKVQHGTLERDIERLADFDDHLAAHRGCGYRRAALKHLTPIDLLER